MNPNADQSPLFDLDALFSLTDDPEEIAQAQEIPQPVSRPSLPPPPAIIEPAALMPKVFHFPLDKSNSPAVQSKSSSTLCLYSSAVELLDEDISLEAQDPSLESGLILPGPDSSFFDPSAHDHEYTYREVVVDKNGQARQAGAMMPEGEWLNQMRIRAEQSLFVFLKGILGRFFLTDHFHKDICNFLQKCPPHRKLVLMPREHAKTTIVSGGLPAHILIQPAESNIYFPGLEGSECRILMSGETETMAKKNLRVVKSIFEENRVFRAFWPHRCWEKSSRQAPEWSGQAIIIPRSNEWPDPTIRAVGVGGAITGARPNVMIKDDLVSFKAANSDVVMEEAIEWHKASRALLDKYEVESGLVSLEFLIGTRWAVYDLYSEIIDNDPSVECNDEIYHRIIRDGKILWPEKYTEADINQLMLEHGSNFFLLYLNSAADPSLTDFDTSLIRRFSVHDGQIKFTGDSRDAYLQRRMETLCGTGEAQVQKAVPGQPLAELRLTQMLKRGVGIRIRG